MSVNCVLVFPRSLLPECSHVYTDPTITGYRSSLARTRGYSGRQENATIT